MGPKGLRLLLCCFHLFPGVHALIRGWFRGKGVGVACSGNASFCPGASSPAPKSVQGVRLWRGGLHPGASVAPSRVCIPMCVLSMVASILGRGRTRFCPKCLHSSLCLTGEQH